MNNLPIQESRRASFDSQITPSNAAFQRLPDSPAPADTSLDIKQPPSPAPVPADLLPLSESSASSNATSRAERLEWVTFQLRRTAGFCIAGGMMTGFGRVVAQGPDANDDVNAVRGGLSWATFGLLAVGTGLNLLSDRIAQR